MKAILVVIFCTIYLVFAEPNSQLLTPDYTSLPTLRPIFPFNATADAQRLRTAMQGLGTDEDAIIAILAHRAESQRYLIEQSYRSQFQRELLSDLKDELTGNLENVIVGLMEGPPTFLAHRLHHANKGIITDNEAIVDIICPRSNAELADIINVYNQRYPKTLKDEIQSDTSSHFRRLILALVNGARRDREPLSEAQARRDAEILFSSAVGTLGTDEDTFNAILTSRNVQHLRLTFKEYVKKAGRTIEDAIRSETSGSMRQALLAIVESAQNRAVYFAKRLHEAMEGIGTNENVLIRIIVSRAEIDLGNIKLQYERLFDRTLASHLESEVSGDFLTVLLALVN